MTTAVQVPQARAYVDDREREVLTPEAVEFLRQLDLRFESRRVNLLEARRRRQKEFDSGVLPDFLAETRAIREAAWKVAPISEELLDRRIEITGPPERKMIINALNSGANVFMADFEDSNSPTWSNCLDGQINLRDANLRTISFRSADGREYKLNDNPAVLFVRPRGWHLLEKHFSIEGRPISASLLDFGLYIFHNAQTLIKRGSAPYFYLPKLESHYEARLWNDVFLYAQWYLGLTLGTIRATVLIETICAAFEMDEILYELRDHSAGLNCGRWDYIFSFVKKFRNHPNCVLPQRGDVTMEQPFLRSYVQLLIHTCHRRETHAMGGMAAQIPIKNDLNANEQAMRCVREDKWREVKAGHDGTWVAHPGLVRVARGVFSSRMPGKNQIVPPALSESGVKSADLLQIPTGRITYAGLRRNVDVALRYLAAWLCGNGCVPIYNLMEDAATAEISRAQIWQWIRHGACLDDDGARITTELFNQVLEHVMDEIGSFLSPEEYRRSKYDRAAELLRDLCQGEFQEFLTVAAYQNIS
jgi:malate synthase